MVNLCGCCKRPNAADQSQPAEYDSAGNPFKPNHRKCTDILCLLFFLVFWIGMIIIAAVGYQHGQPKRLIYGTDWMGRTCGAKADATDTVPAYDLTAYEYIIYPRLTEDLLLLEAQSDGSNSITDASNLKKLYGVCVSECPSPSNTSNALYVHAYVDYEAHADPVNTASTALSDSTKEDTSAGSPWKVMIDTTSVIYRCLELTKIESKMYARCLDDCTAEEEAAYASQSNPTITCGANATLNQLIDCGDRDCADVILEIRPNCSNIETATWSTEVAPSKQDPVSTMLSRNYYMVARWIGDVQKAAFPILICGGAFAMVLGFFWLILLRYCAGFFVWFVILLVCAMQIVITIFCAYEGALITDTRLTEAMASMGISTTTTTSGSTAVATTSYVNAAGYQVQEDQVHYWAIACYVMIAVDVVLFLVLIFMCSRIRIAIGIIREASRALQAIPMLTLFPLVPTIFGVGLVAYWLVAAAYIATSADLTFSDVVDTASEITGTNVTTAVKVQVENDHVVNYLLIYHLFGLLWTNQFIQSTAYTIMAGAFCEYYWTLDKRQIGAMPVLRSVWRTLRFHCGSIAFGSLIIAIVQFLRLALEYLDQKMRSAKQANTIVKVVMCCLKCFLWCFEKCLKFINKNAFIVIAMKGKSFCPAMKDSFSLLLSNAARVATVSIISRFLLGMGKVFIAAFAMFFMFLFIRHPPSQLPSFFLGDLADVSSPIFPMLLTGLLGYATASFFMDVYGTGIDTILLCFCEDCSVNKGSDKYYMSDELFAYMDGPAKKNAFKVFQPSTTRDVGGNHTSNNLQSPPPSTTGPILSSSPMTKHNY